MTLARDQVGGGTTVSEAWLNAVQVSVDSAPERRLFQLVTRIGDPLTEEPRIRTAADTLLDDLNLAPVDTVANTIFPARLAATSAGPASSPSVCKKMYPYAPPTAQEQPQRHLLRAGSSRTPCSAAWQ